MAKVPLSNLQLELLKLYSTDVEVNDLKNVKQLLAMYFSKKAIDEADKMWDEQNFSNEMMNKWLDEK